MKYALLTFLLFAVSVQAEEIKTTLQPPALQGKIRALADIRPSYTGVSGEMHTENALEAGYDFSPTNSLFYRQEFTTNLYNPGSTTGVGSSAGDGYVKFTNYNLVPFEGTPFTLGYEARLYMPTVEKRRDAGMLTALRNYIWLKYQASKNFNVFLGEVPVFHVYNKVGSGNAANPVFENKVELVGEYTFNERVKLVVPLKLSTVKYSSYAPNALNNDAWTNFLYLYPELHYRLTPNWKVGAAFYTGALTNSSFSGLTLGDGFKASVFQTFFVASL